MPPPKPLVAIDSMTLVWGVRKKGPKEMLDRAKWLFDALERDQAQIIIPSVAVSEYLTALDAKSHGDTLAEITARFDVRPFDVHCASKAATLFVEGREAREMETENVRKCLRADSFIVATAVCAGATVLYSHDSDIRNLAERAGMAAEDLPTIPPDLFGYSED